MVKNSTNKRKWTAKEVKQWYCDTGAFTYANPDDLNIVVKKPKSEGLTVNWANPKAYLLQGVILAVVLALVCALELAGCAPNKIDKTQPVFETENIKRITVYSMPDFEDGILIPSEDMDEVINWIGSFRIDKEAGKEGDKLDPGTGVRSLGIEYLDGTIVESDAIAITIDGTIYYMKSEHRPECIEALFAKKRAEAEMSTVPAEVLYYKNEDGTWDLDGITYKFRFEITGRMPNAAVDTTFVYLSNLETITFEQAWKAAGFSSNSADYFAVEDAVLVEMKTH